ncbi:transposase [Chryseobacterium polytrichastri]|uniref:transposase n=1 Tax=Chryseobacterium polytrichastri TaxID=1302687 RepID=UPI001587ACBC|nr:transposase [Chryseobacterium polytrichastri]
MWFLLQRIRVCISIENSNELSGIVECDETFIGGKNKEVKKDQGRNFKNKTPAMGMLQKGGKMNTYVINDTKIQSDKCSAINL